LSEERSHFFFGQRAVFVGVGGFDPVSDEFGQFVFRQFTVFVLIHPLEHFRRVRWARLSTTGTSTLSFRVGRSQQNGNCSGGPRQPFRNLDHPDSPRKQV
jgi:hypothetical protein